MIININYNITIDYIYLYIVDSTTVVSLVNCTGGVLLSFSVKFQNVIKIKDTVPSFVSIYNGYLKAECKYQNLKYEIGWL